MNINQGQHSYRRSKQRGTKSINWALGYHPHCPGTELSPLFPNQRCEDIPHKHSIQQHPRCVWWPESHSLWEGTHDKPCTLLDNAGVAFVQTKSVFTEPPSYKCLGLKIHCLPGGSVGWAHT